MSKSTESTNSASDEAPSQSGGSIFDGLLQKWQAISVNRSLDAEIERCRAGRLDFIQEIRKEQVAKSSHPKKYRKVAVRRSDGKTNKKSRAGRARTRPIRTWLSKTIEAPYESRLEKASNGVERVGAAVIGALLTARRLIKPSAYDRMLAHRDELQKNTELVKACERLIELTEMKQRALSREAEKLKADAERLARRAARQKDKKQRVVKESFELSRRARAAQLEVERYAQLQLTRLPMLKERLKRFDAVCVTLHRELQEIQEQLNADTSKRVDELLDSSRAAMARMEQSVNSRVEQSLWPKIRRKFWDWLSDGVLAQFEKTVIKREQKANKLTAQWNGAVVSPRGLFPDLFERLEDSVAHSETRAKESSEALAKVPGFALADMSVVQLQNELKILMDIESSLKAKRLEVEASVRDIEEEVIKSRTECEKWEGRLLMLRGFDESLFKERENRVKLYSTQLTEFIKSKKLLEDERTRMDCRIEVVQEECERVRAKLNEVSPA